MTVGYAAIRETFSRVSLAPADLTIIARAGDGPLRHLENRWIFSDTAGGGSDVDFFVAYEFKSMLLQVLMGAMFEHAVRRFTEAFEARAGGV